MLCVPVNNKGHTPTHTTWFWELQVLLDHQPFWKSIISFTESHADGYSHQLYTLVINMAL